MSATLKKSGLSGLLILIFVLQSTLTKAQNETAKGGIGRSKTNVNYLKAPLLIWNGITVNELFLGADDPDSVLVVKVLEGQAAIDVYGEKGRYGVIIYQTKMKLRQVEFLPKEFVVKRTGVFKFFIRKILKSHKSGKPVFMFNDIALTSKHYYFDIDNVDSFKLLKRTQAMGIYGKKGENGAIIFKTKTPVTWITSKGIIKQVRAQSACKPRTLILQSDQKPWKDDKTKFTRRKIAHFEKEFIKEVVIDDTNGDCVVIVKFKK